MFKILRRYGIYGFFLFAIFFIYSGSQYYFYDPNSKILTMPGSKTIDITEACQAEYKKIFAEENLKYLNSSCVIIEDVKGKLGGTYNSIFNRVTLNIEPEVFNKIVIDRDIVNKKALNQVLQERRTFLIHEGIHNLLHKNSYINEVLKKEVKDELKSIRTQTQKNEIFQKSYSVHLKYLLANESYLNNKYSLPEIFNQIELSELPFEYSLTSFLREIVNFKRKTDIDQKLIEELITHYYDGEEFRGIKESEKLIFSEKYLSSKNNELQEE